MGASKTKQKLVFVEAERIASSFPLAKGDVPEFLKPPILEGLLSTEEVDQVITDLQSLDVDEYIRRSVSPSENPKRKPAPDIIRSLGGKIIREINEGPLYLAEIILTQGDRARRLVFLAQNRKVKNGSWMPAHHDRAAELVREYSSYGMPIVTFIDTTGADAGEEANLKNQAHSISHLIMEMANLQLPSIGIVYGNGYSGGAIPLATTNILLSVRDGVFNTIHPMGLAEIAYNYNLSWQECAKYVGVSSYELFKQGYLDGIIDYAPGTSPSTQPILDAIFSALDLVETQALDFLVQKENEYFFTHYKESIQRYLNPSELLVEENRIADKLPSGMLNVFGSVFRFQRYLKLRTRLASQSVRRYSRVDSSSMPEGELSERTTRERKGRFEKWLSTPLEIRYDESLAKRYKRFVDTEKDRDLDRNALTAFFRGNPLENYARATEELVGELGWYLYNFWKVEARDNLIGLSEYLQGRKSIESVSGEQANILDLLDLQPVRDGFPGEVKNLILFDVLYDKLLDNLPSIAVELRDTNQITRKSMEGTMDTVFQEAHETFETLFGQKEEQGEKDAFYTWLTGLVSRKDVEKLMRQVSEWKRLANPRLSETLFGIISYYFSHLLPSYNEARTTDKEFDGKINPRNIGIKDFWNRLNQAYTDLLVHNLLGNYKKTTPITPQNVIETYFSNFAETNDDLMTGDSARFPGYRQSIERALISKIPPVGVITGFADFSHNGVENKVGLVVSNTRFQAGAFDMASGEKVVKLMVECAVNQLPLVMFISSGGMQTKEGAGSLFSMAVLNDRITRFVKDFDLPVICFGFRDCTGGAQASFVTHRLVKTYYMSGCVMPFAGQRVVPSHLPAHATLANYFAGDETAMDGLVKNPFDENIDKQLKKLDPSISLPAESAADAIARVLQGEYKPQVSRVDEKELPKEFIAFSPVKRLLIHARGATATRLVQGAQAAGVEVVLVQSDADMESRPAKLLQKQDRLVCLGGNTPQESYLNGMSVIRIAEQEGADTVHPGIGFLSENPDFALLVRKNRLNFIGPRAVSMELMGNKSNAIATSRRLKVGVVPGSQGVVTDPDYAAKVADEIGYPVLIKAAFGGGGKGMCIVYKAETLKEDFIRTSQEALSAFGNGDVYLEKFVESMRHVEVQVLRDSHGNTLILGHRDCSVQRNNQKLVEESDSTGLAKERIDEIYEYGRKIADDINYVGAGTIEFIYDIPNDAVYFMEMNTRLQVEHPVTEMVTGVDIVKEQIRIASGESIGEIKSTVNGYAMEIRVNAEKMGIDAEGKITFTPSPGVVTNLKLPEEKNIRIVSAVDEGDPIPPYYDSLIVQIIAHGKTRADTIKTLKSYLKRVEVEGVYTNLALMEAIIDDPVFKKGDYDTNFLFGFYERANPKKILEQTEKRNSAAGKGIDQEAIRIENSDELRVLAPRTGVFYISPSPEDPPFVEVGVEFDIHQTIGLMEAMKVFENVSLSTFNVPDGEPLFAENQNFTITRVFAESGQTVNQGDLLFIIKPVGENKATSDEAAA